MVVHTLKSACYGFSKILVALLVLTYGVHSQPTPAFSSFPAQGATPPVQATPGISVGACVFPSSWRQGRQWWRGYLTPNQDTDTNYLYETFATNTITSFEKARPGQEKDLYKCLTAGRRDGRTYIYVLIDKNLNYHCREYVEADGTLLVRAILSGRVPGTFPSVSECAGRLASMSSYQVLPQVKPQTGEVVVKDCPLVSGVYSTEITEHAGSGPRVYCRDSPDSTTSVLQYRLNVKSCRHTNTYSQPYYSELKCMASWDGDVFGNNFGPIAASDRSLLLYYENETDKKRPHFFVGRYRTDGQGKVTLSLYVADTQKITSILTAKADEQSIAYRIFSLKRIGDVREPVGTGVVSQTVDPVSAKCPGKCLKGVCQQNSGLWQCVCDHGHSGTNCEKTLEAGSCANNPCENGVCEQQGRFYYCRCKEGFTGLTCKDIAYCTPNPCMRGKCDQYQGGYQCTCPDGYTGRLCAELNVVAEAQEDQKVLIILTTLLSVFVIAIVIVSILICQCKRKKEEKSIPANTDGELPNQTYSSMTSWFPDYKRELAVAEEANSP